jgi:uncharacterized membrane protein
VKWLVAYVASGAVFLAGDFAWLGLMGPRLYRPALGPLLADSVRPAPAVLFYLLYLLGVVVFAVEPAVRAGVWHKALVPAALFGLVAYATYDLTNQATLKLWPMTVTVADMTWGAVITTLAAAAGAAAANALASS